MKIRILKAFGGYKVGQEFDWADGMARIYCGRGMAEAIKEESLERLDERKNEPVVEEAQIEPKVERATLGSRRKPK